jgi:hypothetical protein
LDFLQWGVGLGVWGDTDDASVSQAASHAGQKKLKEGFARQTLDVPSSSDSQWSEK